MRNWRRANPDPQQSKSQFLRRKFGTDNSGADLLERGVARSGRIVAEWAESAVVSRAEPLDGNEFCGFENPITHLLRSFDLRIDGINDTNKNRLIGTAVFADQSQHARAVLLTRQLEVEVAGVKREKAGSSPA